MSMIRGRVQSETVVVPKRIVSGDAPVILTSSGEVKVRSGEPAKSLRTVDIKDVVLKLRKSLNPVPLPGR